MSIQVSFPRGHGGGALIFKLRLAIQLDGRVGHLLLHRPKHVIQLLICGHAQTHVSLPG